MKQLLVGGGRAWICSTAKSSMVMVEERKMEVKTVDTYVSSLRGLLSRSLDKDEGRDVSIWNQSKSWG